MQQLILITGLSEWAKSAPTAIPDIESPCFALRREDPAEIGSHILTLGPGIEYAESLFSWRGVAKDIVFVNEYEVDLATLNANGRFFYWNEQTVEEIAGLFSSRPAESADDQWIMDAAGEWSINYTDRRAITFDGENPFAMVGDIFSTPEKAHRIAQLMSVSPDMYVALKSARDLLGRIYNEGKFDFNHVALEIMGANAALAKAVGKGGENG